MDLLTIIIAVATAITGTIILNALFAQRIRLRLNEWAARKTAVAEKQAQDLAKRLAAETEAVETTLAALRSERMRAVATFRKSSKKPAFMDDEEEDDEETGEVMKWLGKMAENPIVRAMARKNDVDVDALVSGDEGEWDRLDQILHGKKPKRTADDQDAGDQDRQAAPPADPPRSFL